MPPTAQSREALAYAERLRAWLPRRVQELREAAQMSRYALEKASGVSRDMIGSVEPVFRFLTCRTVLCRG